MSRHIHGCHDCIHNGQCDGLPRCGGSCWEPAYGECAQCGGLVNLDDAEFSTEDGEVFCSEECMKKYVGEEGAGK